MADLNPHRVWQLADLPDGTTVRDSMGDVGVIREGWINYPETAPLTLAYAQRYAPFKVVTEPGDSSTGGTS